jgi:uncharacterized protein involved in exopolysaccharide biosynthesis
VQTQKVAGPIEESLPYQERALLIPRVAALQAELAELPAPGEEDATPDVLDQRAPTEAIAARLRRRIAVLDDQIAQIVTASNEIENLKSLRASKTDSIREMADMIGKLGLKLEAGGPVRVLTPAKAPDARSFPTPAPVIATVALVGGILGLIVGVARS